MSKIRVLAAASDCVVRDIDTRLAENLVALGKARRAGPRAIRLAAHVSVGDIGSTNPPRRSVSSETLREHYPGPVRARSLSAGVVYQYKALVWQQQ